MTSNNNMVVYNAKTGSISLKQDKQLETIWATQKQIAQLFDVNTQAITKHIDNIYSEGELIKNPTCSKKEQVQKDPTIRNFRIVQKEGNRSVNREVLHYNLDMIISVGYRVNSKQATNFRKWATSTLKDHITKGYSINQEFFASRKIQAQKAIEEIRLLAKDNDLISKDNVIDIIESFTNTWFDLQKYDEDDLPKQGVITGEVNINSDDLYKEIAILKQNLIDKKQAADLFAQEKQQGSLDAILQNVMQNVFGSDVYPTIDEKAANLLYFIIKNHPFNDGNKRTGAFSFIWFLKKCEYPFIESITPNLLTTLTLFIAESHPKAKERIIGLILQLLRFSK